MRTSGCFFGQMQPMIRLLSLDHLSGLIKIVFNDFFVTIFVFLVFLPKNSLRAS